MDRIFLQFFFSNGKRARNHSQKVLQKKTMENTKAKAIFSNQYIKQNIIMFVNLAKLRRKQCTYPSDATVKMACTPADSPLHAHTANEGIQLSRNGMTE